MPTKAFHRFQLRCSYMEGDEQLTSALVGNFRNLPNSGDSLSVALGYEAREFKRLNQQNTEMSRRVKSGHLLSSVRASFIKDIYEDFLEFLSTTLARAAEKGIDPNRFAGDAKVNFDAKDLLAAGGWIQVVRLISDAIFRSVESERNSKKLIEKTVRRLGLDIDPAVIDTALPYFEVRHLLVHADGKTDESFRRKFPHIRRKNSNILIDEQLTIDAKDALVALAKSIDDQVIERKLVSPVHMMG